MAVGLNWTMLQDFLTELEKYSYILGAILIGISAVFYLIELLRSENFLSSGRDILFWVSIGLLFFYVGIIPFTLAREYYANFNYVHSIFLIIYLLGTVMYLLFAFGFMLGRRKA